MSNSAKMILALSVVATIAAGTSIYFFNQHNKLAKSIVENEKMKQLNEAISFLNTKTPIVVEGFKLQNLKPVA
jgi:hypothetical protein